MKKAKLSLKEKKKIKTAKEKKIESLKINFNMSYFKQGIIS